jgi:hypothetical protein
LLNADAEHRATTVAEQDESLADYSFLYETKVESTEDTGGKPNLLTIECKYFETLQDLREKRLQEVKFWTYREDAMALAALLMRVAQAPIAEQN